MNGDLISRKALLEEINGEENRRADALMSEWYADMVYRQPIAFEVDKVVEQLKEEGCIVDDVAGNRAVEIIRSGGAENKKI